MKAIVVYRNLTGFTEQYAKWIAEELSCDIKPLAEATVENLSQYDMVLYGGWLRAGIIVGLGKIKKLTPNIAAVFAVGAAPLDPSLIANIHERSSFGKLPLFYLQGGIHFDQLGFINKLIVRMAVRYFDKQAQKANPDVPMQPTPTTGTYGGADKRNIQALIDFITAQYTPPKTP